MSQFTDTPRLTRFHRCDVAMRRLPNDATTAMETGLG
jgi:hypothetical protein